MFKFLLGILKDEFGGTLAITRKTSNTLITASGFNTNYDEIEAEVNSLDTANYADDSVTAAKLSSDVVRADYGLKQHTDGSLFVDVSDTTPGLELTDGGLRVKVKAGLIARGSDGIDWGRANDILLTAAATTPDGFTDVSATYVNKFIRIAATALSAGGADTHSHTLAEANLPAHTHTISLYGNAPAITNYPAASSDSSSGTASTSSVGSGTAFTGDNVPAYITLRMCQHN